MIDDHNRPTPHASPIRPTPELAPASTLAYDAQRPTVDLHALHKLGVLTPIDYEAQAEAQRLYDPQKYRRTVAARVDALNVRTPERGHSKIHVSYVRNDVPEPVIDGAARELDDLASPGEMTLTPARVRMLLDLPEWVGVPMELIWAFQHLRATTRTPRARPLGHDRAPE